MNTAIIISSHGTTDEEAKKSSLDRIAETFKRELPFPIYESYYGKLAIEKYPEYQWERMVGRLTRDGINRTVIVPTFMTSGKTWRDFEKEISEYPFTLIMKPLLEDGYLREFAAMLRRIYAPHGTENVLLVGHGAGDNSDEAYRTLEGYLNEDSEAIIHIELLHRGSRDGEAFRQMLLSYRNTITLYPLLITAGYHVHHDIFGEKNSLAQRIRAYGYEVTSCTHSLGEYQEFREYLVSAVRRNVHML